MQLSDFLGYAGVLDVALLGAALIVASRGSGRGLLLGVYLLLACVAMGAIMITHAVEGSREAFASAVEHVAVLALVPSLYVYVRAALNQPVSRNACLALFLIPATFIVGWAPLIALRVAEAPPAALMVAYHVAFTTATAAFFLHWHKPKARGAHEFWWPAILLGVTVVVHVGQLARLFGAAGAGDENVVPLLGGLGGIAGLFAGLVFAHFGQRRSGPRYANSTLGADHLRACYQAILDALTRQALHRRPDLALADLAAAANVSEKHASQALSEIGQTSFHALVAMRRVEDAKRLLRLPANAKVAVEPIGMEAGFRSRSAFYAAFRAATGLTPAEFRRKGAEIVPGPSGQDTLPDDVGPSAV